MKRIFIAFAMFAVCALPAQGAQQPAPSCTWSPEIVAAGGFSTITAVNLPTNRPISLGGTYPTGGGTIYPGGTLTATYQFWETTTVYVWSRGGGGSLFNAGKQLGDYHPIAVCTVTVR